MGRNIVAMVVSGFVYFLLALLIEYKFFMPLLWSDKPVNLDDVESEKTDEDEDVARERKRIRRGRGNDSVLRMEELTKVCV